MRSLLIGCGHSREKRISNQGTREWLGELTTLDFLPRFKPDVVHDLNELPYPFPDNSFDEIHAYEVLEHCGRQGDYVFFFAQFTEFWRILKPGGELCATVPAASSPWAWGDPSHTRIVSLESLTFLSQSEYERQVGVTPMSDYRDIYSADFCIKWHVTEGDNFAFVLEAIKTE